MAIAAHDKRINDDTWRLLEPGRKELLLPLGDEKLMRKAATHVMKLKLSLRLTRQYVKTLRENTPQEKQTRLAPAQLRGQVTRFLGRVEDEGFEKRLHATVKGMTDEERKELAAQAAALRAFAERLSRVARGKEVG